MNITTFACGCVGLTDSQFDQANPKEGDLVIIRTCKYGDTDTHLIWIVPKHSLNEFNAESKTIVEQENIAEMSNELTDMQQDLIEAGKYREIKRLLGISR